MIKEEFMAKMKADVGKFGWHCLSVFPTEDDEGEIFTYTVGLTETFNHPEIMIFGLSKDTAHGILADCVERIRNGGVFLPSEEYSNVIGGGYKVVFKRVKSECLSEYFGMAGRYYEGKDFSGLIMFWPSKNHRFPWDEPESVAQREALTIVQPGIPSDASGADEF